MRLDGPSLMGGDGDPCSGLLEGIPKSRFDPSTQYWQLPRFSAAKAATDRKYRQVPDLSYQHATAIASRGAITSPGERYRTGLDDETGTFGELLPVEQVLAAHSGCLSARLGVRGVGSYR